MRPSQDLARVPQICSRWKATAGPRTAGRLSTARVDGRNPPVEDDKYSIFITPIGRYGRLLSFAGPAGVRSLAAILSQSVGECFADVWMLELEACGGEAGGQDALAQEQRFVGDLAPGHAQDGRGNGEDGGAMEL